MYQPMKNYPVGTEIQYRNGVTRIKTSKGWTTKSRFIAEHQLLDRPLEKGEKVYHKDCTSRGELGYDHKDNLVVLKFRTSRFVLLPKSRILFIPKVRKVDDVAITRG